MTFEQYLAKVYEKTGKTVDDFSPLEKKKLRNEYSKAKVKTLQLRVASDPEFVEPFAVKELADKVSYHRNSSQWKRIKKTKEVVTQIGSENLLQREANIQDIEENESDRQKAITFLFPESSRTLSLAPRSLCLIAAATNQGKSTLACNIVVPLVDEQKKVLFLSNEESEGEVRTRVSCIRLGLSYGAYKNNYYSTEVCSQIRSDVKLIESQLIVVGSTTDQDKYRTRNADGIVRTLKAVAGKVDCVILDYFQRVLTTDAADDADYLAQKQLTVDLDALKHEVGCPIILFAQIQPLVPSSKEQKEEKVNYPSHHPLYRWRGSKEIIFSATDILELFSNRQEGRSMLFAHKVRFRTDDHEEIINMTFNKKETRYYLFNIEDAACRLDELVTE